MRRPTSLLTRLIACLALAWQPSTALGAEEDTQVWIYAIVQGDISDDWRLTADGTARWRERARGDEQQTLRFTLDTVVAEGVRAGGGFGAFETEGGASELRPHQQLTVRRGRFAARTRIEQRFFDGADRMELRLRQRIGYIQPLSQRVSATIEGEYLHIAQTRDRNPLAARDQWRGRIVLQYRAQEDLSLAAAYLAIHTPRPEAEDRLNHVPQLLVPYRF